MKKYIIVVAGGSGKRMQAHVPKQFLPINGKPVLMRTLERIHNYDSSISIVLVIPEAHRSYWNMLCNEYAFNVPYILTNGGSERFYSVKNALEFIPDDCVVAVHDGVRPFVSNDTLKAVFEAVEEKKAVIPIVAPSESMRVVDGDTNSIIDRNTVKLVQTPQCFTADVLKKAYSVDYDPMFTDDASVVETVLNIPIFLVEGNRENIKFTTAFDMLIAEAIYESFASQGYF